MHDPSILALTVHYPIPRQLKINGKRVAWRFPALIDVWHDDPNGHDAGTVCHIHDRNAWWFIKHARHLRFNVIPWRQFKRWKWQRCQACGGKSRRYHPVNTSINWGGSPQKFRQSAPGLFHGECSGIVHLKRGLAEANEAIRVLGADAADLELRGMDSTKSWRVIYYATNAKQVAA